MSPNPGKVREVKEWPTPKNKTELEAFLVFLIFKGSIWIGLQIPLPVYID